MNTSLIPFSIISTFTYMWLNLRREQSTVRNTQITTTTTTEDNGSVNITKDDMKYVQICRDLLTNVPR